MSAVPPSAEQPYRGQSYAEHGSALPDEQPGMEQHVKIGWRRRQATHKVTVNRHRLRRVQDKAMPEIMAIINLTKASLLPRRKQQEKPKEYCADRNDDRLCPVHVFTLARREQVV